MKRRTHTPAAETKVTPPTASPAEPATETTPQRPGNLMIQRALAVGSADDPAEAEADRVASHIMRAPCHCGGRCPKCRGNTIRRSGEGQVSTGAGNQAVARLGGGRPLDRGTRAFFEPRLGRDFSDVRVHTDTAADASARQLKAKAFTAGRDIAFGAGRYDPHSRGGRELLAHELVHVVQQDGVIRRNGGGDGDAAGGLDPCGVDVPSLDNAQLLAHFQRAESYLDGLISSQRRGEDEYFDYAHLLRRLTAERGRRATAGHVWLNAEVTAVPGTLWMLVPMGMGGTIAVTPGDTAGASANTPIRGGILVTQDQFDEMLDRENIPRVDATEYFGQQDPEAPVRPLELTPPGSFDGMLQQGIDPLATPGPLGPLGPGPSPFMPPLPTGAAPTLPRSTYGNWGAFTPPVVTGGPQTYNPAQVGGFRTDWRGDWAEALLMSQRPHLVDLNVHQNNFPLFDPYDPRSGLFISVKSQLPTTPGDPAARATVQTAFRELFGSADPSKRTSALTLLQTHVDPTLDQSEMLRRSRVAVNPENVVVFQDALESAITRSRSGTSYEPILTALMADQPVSVQLKDGTTRSYSDFTSLHADRSLISQARYKTAVEGVAQRARSQVVGHVADAETHLRPVMDYRQGYDFRGASDFSGFPDTTAGHRQSRSLQELYFRRMAVPELADVQMAGGRWSPTMTRATVMGTGMSAVTSFGFGLPGMVSNWDTDPYAGRRYLAHSALGTIGGGGTAATDQAWRLWSSQRALDYAASRSIAGQSISGLSRATPLIRGTGSSLLGGFSAGGITLGSMWLDEQYFGADYTPVDYQALGGRAFVVGTASGAAGFSVGAMITAGLATGGTAATGGAAGCTVVLPGVGTVGCGAVGAVGGFVVGVGSYFLFDWAFGDAVEDSIRESAGEAGCTGDRGRSASSTPTPSSSSSSGLSQGPLYVCFTAETPVLLASGRSVPIAEVEPGMQVVAIDLDRAEPVAAQVHRVHAPGPAPTLAVWLDGRDTALHVTPEHPLLVDGRWTRAGSIRPGQQLRRWNGTNCEDVAVARVEAPTRPRPVYTLSVGAPHTFLAHGIVVHNK